MIARLLLSLLFMLGQTTRPLTGAGVTKASGGGGGTWSLIQLKYNSSAGGGTGGSGCAVSTTTCTVTVSSVGAGHLVVMVPFSGSSAGTSIAWSAGSGETWTHCGGTNGCLFAGANAGAVDAAYVLSATGGETSFTCTVASAPPSYFACAIFEYAWSGATIAFDASNGAYTSSCTSCSGIGLTLSGSKDVIIQVGLPAQSLTAISGGAGYTNPQQFYDGAGQAGAINTTNGAAPTWTQSPAGPNVAMAIAFKGS